jgi:hypothetical protein
MNRTWKEYFQFNAQKGMRWKKSVVKGPKKWHVLKGMFWKESAKRNVLNDIGTKEMLWK